MNKEAICQSDSIKIDKGVGKMVLWVGRSGMVRGIRGGGEFVQLLREMGFSYRRIAREVGVSKSTVQRWARGEAAPKRENFLRLQMVAVGELVGDRSLREAARALGIPRTTLTRHLRGQAVCRDPARYIVSPTMLKQLLGEDVGKLFRLEQVPIELRKHIRTAATKAPETLPRLFQFNLGPYAVPVDEAAEHLISMWMEYKGIGPDDEEFEEKRGKVMNQLVGLDGRFGILGWARAVGGEEYYARVLAAFALAENYKEAWKAIREFYEPFEIVKEG